MCELFTFHKETGKFLYFTFKNKIIYLLRKTNFFFITLYKDKFELDYCKFLNFCN